MKKVVYVLVLGMVLGIATAVFAQAAKPGQNVMMEMVMISPKIGDMTMISNMGANQEFRTETYKGQGSSKTLQSIMIAKGGFIYMLNPPQKSGMKMAMNTQKDSSKPPETSWDKVMEDKKAKGSTVTHRGKETWEGQEYDVWRVTEKNGTYLDYYLDKNQMAKRFVMYDSKGQMESDSRIIKYEVLKSLPAGILDIPADYKIMDMSQMKIPGMGGSGKP
jgi:hypothetical protein